MGLASIFGDHSSLTYLDHLQGVMLPKIRAAAIDDAAIVHLTTADYKNVRNSSVLNEILEKAIKRMEEKELNGRVVEILTGCLERMVNYKLIPAQIETVITYLQTSHNSLPARAIVFEKDTLEIAVVQLVQTGCFDAHF
jgi:hypothetical protein